MRPWETVGAPGQVSWFPQSRAPVMDTLPAAGSRIAPSAPIYLTFSQPVSEVFGSGGPRLSPATPGAWHETNSHTLVFTPSGFGAALDSQLRIELPRAVAVTALADGGLRRAARSMDRPVRLNAAAAAAARRGGLPAGRLAACGRSGGRSPSAQAQAALEPPTATSAGVTRTHRPSCGRSGARASRTRSRRAP